MFPDLVKFYIGVKPYNDSPIFYFTPWEIFNNPNLLNKPDEQLSLF